MRPIGRIIAAAAVGSMALGMAACTTSTDAGGGSSSDTSTTKSDSSGASKVDTSGEQQDWEKAAVKGDGTKTIYLVSKGFQHRFWQAVKEGAEQAGEELGYKVSFVGPQDETKVTEQTDQLKSPSTRAPRPSASRRWTPRPLRTSSRRLRPRTSPSSPSTPVSSPTSR